ncbi:hypothetical protein HDU98_000716 [Podochytrium sp. JEL0797]|nr:hypothetical protein HDU98_000716 [Podochytrium sp. JEL0797]
MDSSFIHPSRLGHGMQQQQQHGFEAALPPPPSFQQQQQYIAQQQAHFAHLQPAPRGAASSSLDKMDLASEVPYPEGYVPSAKQKKHKKGDAKPPKNAALALPSKPLFGLAARTAPASASTVYAIPRNKMDSGKVVKKKKMLRAAGGEVWEDESLREWDPNDFRLFCGDLGNEVGDELLVRTFSKYPSFVKAKVVREKKTTKSKGYGFVSFKDPNDFVAALKEMDGKYVGNRPIKLRKSTWDERSVQHNQLRKVVTGGLVKKQ